MTFIYKIVCWSFIDRQITSEFSKRRITDAWIRIDHQFFFFFFGGSTQVNRVFVDPHCSHSTLQHQWNLHLHETFTSRTSRFILYPHCVHIWRNFLNWFLVLWLCGCLDGENPDLPRRLPDSDPGSDVT